MPRVMISYRNVDGQREFALEMEKILSGAGIDTWIDVKDIQRGSRWKDEIFKGIINSDYVILCLSPEYFESETCLIECYVARGYGKTILPLIVPSRRDADIFQIIPNFEETKGIDQLQFLDMRTESILGLKESLADLHKRVISAILNPVTPGIEYDVYVSFRVHDAEFATKIADDLNANGIKTYVATRTLDVGVDWRAITWNALLKAKIHIFILSPHVTGSGYIAKEVLVSSTKDTIFHPVLAEDYVHDEFAKSTIRESFETDEHLKLLTEIHWHIPDKGYDNFIQELYSDIQILLEREK